MYDSDAIYIAARLYDRDPTQSRRASCRQGEQVFGDDWFSVMLDPFHDRRSGYRFMTNPNGLRQEGLFQNISEEQWDWQGIWYTASTIDEQGWVDRDRDPVQDAVVRPDERHVGHQLPPRDRAARRAHGLGLAQPQVGPEHVGHGRGLVGLEQGVGLDVVPSALTVDARRDPSTTRAIDRREFEPSLDVFYKITPSLTGALTINTDFSATDVDDRQVNLTRFSLFFPEKRDFFLQDADIFEFGGLEANGRPFFSRRIGLSDSGAPIDLDVGGKITGRVGRFTSAR